MAMGMTVILVRLTLPDTSCLQPSQASSTKRPKTQRGV